METNPREIKGKEIALKKQDVTRINPDYYIVKSQTTLRQYNVIKANEKWICSCPDHTFRHICCKHIHAVEFSIKIREQVQSKTNLEIQPIVVSECLFCHSNNIKKFGVRKNKSGNIQRFVCSDCSKTFSLNLGFEGMRSNPNAITSALQLYFSGESLRSVQTFLRLQGVNVSHKTIYMWVKKYTKIMKEYLEKITPEVGDVWRADEVYVKIRGDMKYLFALMDSETRYWIAQEVADSKYAHDAKNLFRMGKITTKHHPKVLITDGLPAYNEAYKKEFMMKDRKKHTTHFRHIHLKGDMNNNQMERMNGEFRDREKIIRGVKSTDSPLFDGYQIYHNYFRPHLGLDGKTPAEASGIKIGGQNKWVTLIQNASK
jgi:transposase-like protein